MRTESDPAGADLDTLPEPVKHLRVENSTPNSILVKWDPGTINPNPALNIKYTLSLSALNLDDFQYSTELTGDKHVYNFSKLASTDRQDVSGQLYTLEVTSTVNKAAEKEVISVPVRKTVATLPHRPTNFQVAHSKENRISWSKSATPHVTAYRLRWKPLSDEGSKDNEKVVMLMASKGEATLPYTLRPLVAGMVYRVGITAVVEVKGKSKEAPEKIESKELHEKVVVDKVKGLMLWNEE